MTLCLFDINLKVTKDNYIIVTIGSGFQINSLNLLIGTFKSSNDSQHAEKKKYWVIYFWKCVWKTSISALLTMPKPLTVWITINWKILKEMGISDHLICLLRNLYAGQEATVRTGHGTTDWFQIGKGVHHGCILSPCLFNLYAEYIIRNAGLEETQAGIKIAVRNINNLRYADDTTLVAEREELKSLLMKMRGEWKSWLKDQHSEN